MRFDRGTKALGLAAASALALSACASVGGPSGGDEETGGAGGEGSGGVITVAETNNFTSVNSATTEHNKDINGKINYMIREGFTFVDSELNVVKNEGFGTYEVVSENPLTVEYTISEDQQWSDGNAVDQADLMLWWATTSGYYNDAKTSEAGDVESGANYFSIAGSTDILDGTDLPEFSEDGRTMTLTWDEPHADWELALSASDGYLQPAHVVAEQAGMSEEDLLAALRDSPQGDPESPRERPEVEQIAEAWDTAFNFAEMPSDESLLVSNGPYVITDIVKDQSVTLSKNENYQGDHVGQVDEITVRTIGDSTAQIQALRNGEVDIMAPVSVTKDTMDQVSSIEGVQVLEGPQLAYDHVDLNFGADIFEDQAVREAFLKTIPRQQILDQLIKPVVENSEVLNSQLFVTSEEAYEGAVAENGAAEKYPAEPDIEGARRLLDGRTPTVRILYNSENPVRVDTFALIKESAEQAGFTVEDLGDPLWGEKLAEGNYDTSLFGWVSPGVGTEALTQIFKAGGGGNYNSYSNPEVDALATDTRVTLDEEERRQKMYEMDRILFEDDYGLPLFQSPGMFGVAEDVNGVEYMANQTGVFWNFWEWSRG
ncbi:peptide ABC transporter substrate-binding protein [Kocuria dechangensis]|uniref:Peptide ABC transporter substrate-binding protein n=1 Tax=Kocuria dechangensis TaxID=1176249 RepID=A0A917GL25_9MICC|nr:ABC transporter family substrate-binding protein [Kocuria dechangensis]GGG50470.1 peptide ABC transporter substrate-binding protein [Kocuria dechangensis]